MFGKDLSPHFKLKNKNRKLKIFRVISVLVRLASFACPAYRLIKDEFLNININLADSDRRDSYCHNSDTTVNYLIEWDIVTITITLLHYVIFVSDAVITVTTLSFPTFTMDNRLDFLPKDNLCYEYIYNFACEINW